MSSPVKRVVLVGHCGFDAGSLRRAVKQAAPQVDIVDDDGSHSLENLGPDSLLLINRTLGYGYPADTGVELIRKLAEKPDPPRMMLVSNYADAQQEAEEVGAMPGVGKNDLGSPTAQQRLRAAIGA